MIDDKQRWGGNEGLILVVYRFLTKKNFLLSLYRLSQRKSSKSPGGSTNQTKLSMARTPAII
jgi:hypothetical protein